jgi:hypothetical protein
MHRHGLSAEDIAQVRELLNAVRLEGFAFHLPIDRHGGYDPTSEVGDWLRRLTAAGVPTDVAWVSHLTATELAELRAAFPTTVFRPRVGTSLWLGDRSAFTARGTVLDVHRLAAGTRYGYRQRKALRDSWLVWSAGVRRTGLLSRRREPCAGRSAAPRNSPSDRWPPPTGRCRRSAGRAARVGSPNHPTCSVSLLLMPTTVRPPAIGDELCCEVRMTTLRPDRITAR